MKGRKPNLQNVVPMKGEFKKEVPDAPDFLDDLGRAVWDELVPELVRKDRMEILFRYQFATYCAAVSKFIQATNDLALEGLTYETGKGRNGNQRRPNPAIAAQSGAISEMNRGAAVFGLSPVDAARLEGGGQGDLFDEVVKQLNGTN